MRSVLGIVLLTAAAVVATWHRAPMIEAALEREIGSAMTREGLAGIGVAVDGLDVTLTGEVSDRQRQELARRTAESVPGARTVVSQVVVSTRALASQLEAEEAPTDARPPVVSWDSCQAEIDERLAERRIDFESSRAEITPATESLLEALTEVLVRCGEARIEIAGHTDASGFRNDNLELSRHRAEAVMARLTAAGIAAERLTAVGYGPDQPLVDNATAEGRAQNRRIELRVQHP